MVLVMAQVVNNMEVVMVVHPEVEAVAGLWSAHSRGHGTSHKAVRLGRIHPDLRTWGMSGDCCVRS